MTWANRITIFRILLIPIFVGALLYYAQTFQSGVPNETFRTVAIIIFIVAAMSDGVDGYLARHFNQKSRLGTILDPLADKLLMFSALLTFGFIGGPAFASFPLWFSILIIGRDVILLIGAALLHYLVRHVEVRAHWTGKVSTCLVFISISAALLQMPWTIWVCYVGGFFTLICTVIYVCEGLRQFHHSGYGHAQAPKIFAAPEKKS